MKRTLALTLALTLSSFSAFSATTATLLLKGSIPEVLSIAVSPEAVASALDLTTTQNLTKVATVEEKSNSNTGYSVNIKSQNLGNLVNGAEEFPYSLSYNGSAINLSTATGQTISNPAAAAITVNKDVKVSYTGVPAEELVAGDYGDLITFTISAN